jgi:hypothetical protein
MKMLLVLVLGMPVAAAAAGMPPACGCGPDYCVDTPGYQRALAAKKAAAARNGAPARLVALYDKLDHCEASLSQSPDAFNILRHESDGAIRIDGWTEENEKIDAAAVRTGTMKACYVILARTAFACCGSARPEDRPDYDKTLSMNRSTALPCQ